MVLILSSKPRLLLTTTIPISQGQTVHSAQLWDPDLHETFSLHGSEAAGCGDQGFRLGSLTTLKLARA